MTSRVRRRLPVKLLAGLLLGALLSKPALAQPPSPAASTASPVYTRLELMGRAFDVEWHLPAGPPRGRLWLQHGFGRQCANLRGTARRAADAGLATACLSADMAGGAPALAMLLASALAADEPALRPPGLAEPTPPRWLLAGHSAGALFAAHVALGMAQAAPASVAGLLLLDPVGGRVLADALSVLGAGGARPVWAVLAPPSRCNAQQQALPALQRLQAELLAGGSNGFVGVQWAAGATHLDAEGEDTEALAVWACGEGWPQPAVTEALRELLAAWAVLAWEPAAQQRGGSDAITRQLLREGRAAALHGPGRLNAPEAPAPGP